MTKNNISYKDRGTFVRNHLWALEKMYKYNLSNAWDINDTFLNLGVLRNIHKQ